MEGAEMTFMGGICPNCSGVVLSPASDQGEKAGPEMVLLSCGHCGLDFMSDSDDLLFQAIPLSWFSQGNA